MKNLLTLDEGEALAEPLETSFVWSLTDKELTEEFRIMRAQTIRLNLLDAIKMIEEKFDIPTGPHRPDVKAGKGYRILNHGEAVEASDEMKDMICRRPFKLAWVPVSSELHGKRVNNNFIAIRRAVTPSSKGCKTPS